MTGTRTILHVDMDAFYVSVELLRRPELAGRPVVVGGTGRRGVVAAASYEARKYGVHSAMPSAIARRRCPHAVFLAGDHARYAEVGAQIRGVFERFTPLVEPLSLDEAFLDVTGEPGRDVDGRRIAETVRQQVLQEVSLQCSVGVAPNKFLAKLASVEAKPVVSGGAVQAGAGVVAVGPGNEQSFLAPLAVERMWGVGPVTLRHMHGIGIRTIGELAAADPVILSTALGGRSAASLLELAHGRDTRPVEPDRALRSVSHEETFADDLFDDAEIRRQLVRQCDGVATRLRTAALAARTVTLKVRYGDFTTITRSATVPDACDTTDEILAVVSTLLAAIETQRGVRLLGVVASKLGPPHRQLRFDDLRPDEGGDGGRADDTVDEIRSRFGAGAIGPASMLDGDGLRPMRAGTGQWGPNRPDPLRRVEDQGQTCETEHRAEE